MRAIIKCSYFNQQKNLKAKKPDKQKLNIGIEKLNNYYLRRLARAYQELMINMINHMKKELDQIFNKVNNRIIATIFKTWREMTLQPQPFKLQLPQSPPTKGDTSRSATKKPMKTRTQTSDIRFYTPGRDSTKSAYSIEEQHNQIALKFRLQNIWNKLKQFSNFQKHLAFKSKHFRNFYIIRKYFYFLLENIQTKKNKLIQFQQAKMFYILRVNFSKWYEYIQRKKKNRFILQKWKQRTELFLLRKGLKGLFLNLKQQKSLTIQSPQQIEQQNKKLKLIPKK